MLARRVLTVLLLQSGVAAPGVGQEIGSDPGIHEREIRRQLGRHERVRILAGGQLFELTNAHSDSAGIVLLGLEGEERHIPFAAVDRLEYRTSAWRKGFTIGAAGGGVLGLLLGVAYAVDDNASVNAGEAVLIGAAAAVFYGTVGALAGAPFKQWRTAYRRPADTRAAFSIAPVPGKRLGAAVAVWFSTGGS